MDEEQSEPVPWVAREPQCPQGPQPRAVAPTAVCVGYGRGPLCPCPLPDGPQHFLPLEIEWKVWGGVCILLTLLNDPKHGCAGGGIAVSHSV